MNSQWHSHERWGTMGFVPLTIVSLLCFFQTWSCHKPAVPAAVALPQTSLLGNWHGLVWNCSGAASLSPCSKKITCLVVATSTTKMAFFFSFVATEEIPYCRVCPTHQTFCRVLSQWSWAVTLLDAIWGSSESWNDPVLRETPLQRGTACLQHPLQPLPCSTEAPLWIGKLSLLLVPSFVCTYI